MFGKAFRTKVEAKAFLKAKELKGNRDLEIRKMSKKLFPRREKLWHVGTFVDFLNFA